MQTTKSQNPTHHQIQTSKQCNIFLYSREKHAQCQTVKESTAKYTTNQRLRAFSHIKQSPPGKAWFLFSVKLTVTYMSFVCWKCADEQKRLAANVSRCLK